MSDENFQQWAGEELSHIRRGLTIRAPSENQSIFKYISLDNEKSWDKLVKSLNTLQLHGSTSSELNDPFEAAPTPFDDLDANCIATAIGHRYPISWNNQAPPPTPIEELFADIAPYRLAAQAYLLNARSESRIVAFCERPDSGLLWSHYASSYSGACLHFLAGAFPSTNRYTFGYVNYSQHRPIYPLSLALSLAPDPAIAYGAAYNSSMAKVAESDKILFFTKAAEWAYESELRLVYRPCKTMDSVNFVGRKLLSIIVGPQMSDSNRARLVDIVGESEVKDVSIRRARLSRTSFSVEID